MKFLVVKTLHEDKGFRPLLFGLLFFTLMFLVVDVLVKAESFGLSYTTLFNTLYGNEEEYLDAMEASVFLEFWHVDIFLMMMVLLTLSAIYIRFSSAKKFNLIVVNTTLISALLSLITFALSFYMSDLFLLAYLTTFWFWHVGALWMVLGAFTRLLRA